MITALISVRGFSGEYNYHSVDVKGTEFTSVAVPLIYMAAGLQNFEAFTFDYALLHWFFKMYLEKF
jgi:hypothetical protein